MSVDRKRILKICLLLQAQKPKKNCEVESIKISYSFAFIYLNDIFMHEKL